MSFLYHITPIQHWEAAQKKGTYDFDSLKVEGFIHCSLKEQVVRVANSRFKGRTDLILLQIDEAKITSQVIYENLEGGQEKFPHIYGPLNLDAVLKVFPFDPNAEGEFSHPERRSNPRRATIRPMEASEYESFQRRLLANYSEDVSQSAGISLEKATESAKKQIADLLTDGMKTPRHYFFSIIDFDKQFVGNIWYAVIDNRGKDCVFIYDIHIDEAHRGKGYGSMTLRWLEIQTKALGLSEIRLHVFGHNEDAQRLYAKLGYAITNVQMSKRVG